MSKISSGFERDPDLDPIKPPAGAEPMATVAAAKPAPARPAAPAPDIRPADPAAWSKVVPLEFALLVDGVRLDAITLRRPTGADIAELMEEDDDQETLPNRLYARICGLHPAVLGQLWPDDSERVAAAARPFLPRLLLDIEDEPAVAEAGG